MARLKRWLYGMRPAAKACEEEYTANLQRGGFRRGASATTVFYDPRGYVSLVVQGTDFTALGPVVELRAHEAKMQTWYDVKTRG